MNVYNDDEVFQKLKDHYATTTPSGKVSYAKANRIFRFFRDIKNEGFAEVKRVASNGSFYRNLDLLTAVVPRAYLQNLHSVKSNIIPLVRLVNVDFSKPTPSRLARTCPYVTATGQQFNPTIKACRIVRPT